MSDPDKPASVTLTLMQFDELVRSIDRCNALLDDISATAQRMHRDLVIDRMVRDIEREAEE